MNVDLAPLYGIKAQYRRGHDKYESSQFVIYINNPAFNRLLTISTIIIHSRTHNVCPTL